LKLLSVIRPKYIIAITLGVALLMFGSAFVELRQSRNELLHVLQEQSLSLAEAIAQSSANVVLSTDQIEQQLTERLLNNAYYIARFDSLNILSRRDLQKFARDNDIYRINIFNSQGEKILGNHEQLPHHGSLGETMSPREMLGPILKGERAQLIIGLKQARFEEGQRFAVAIRRTRPGGGAIVLNLDAAELVEFRKRIGIGKLVKDLGDNTGIDYVVIQDRDGVLAATSQVHEISSIEHDSLLTSVLDRDTVITRQTKFNGHDTFEVVKRLSVEGATVGVLRIGLSMDEIRATEDRMTRRMLLMSIVLVAIGALVFTAIVINQNYAFISEKYARMRSLTGNILLNMGDAVVTVDGDDRVTIFSRQAEELFGSSAGEVAGKKLDELPAALAGCLSAVFAARSSEIELECQPGSRRTVSISLSSTIQSDGLIETRTAVIKDLTEARRLEQELQRTGKLTAMGVLASGVAHEIRNPLNAISMIAQRYEREFVPRKGLREYRSLTSVLKQESSRVNSIIQQFLTFARPPKLKRETVLIEQFVNHVATFFRGQAKGKDIRFTAECHAKGSVSIDAEQMTQALLNLLQNALDATPRGGTIRLEAERSGKDVVFSVTDSGTGISPDNINRIFDLYFTTKSDGTGMGLAITQQIVSQHGGRIDVTSGPEKGSTFAIKIPPL
jgi:two-component system sensor histidine kinase HydH